ncbi:hypothetical protein Q1695_000889 [Nippostrongylus brasiliensis]|nr:hypothetical protein Q1695_000889 [Nippostrongylus brasiliensis]
MSRNSEQQESTESKPRQLGYVYLPELEIQAASPPRSPGPLSGTSFDEAQLLFDARRPSSPQAIPGLPQLKLTIVVTVTELAQWHRNFGTMEEWFLGNSNSMHTSSDLFALRTLPTKKTKKEMENFVLRKRASTIGTRIPIPRRALSRSSGDSLRVPDRESPLHFVTMTEMNPEFQCIRQLILNLLTVFTKRNKKITSTMKECSDVLRQILNSPQHPNVKNW